MDIRHNTTAESRSEAQFSDCGYYRYLLSRHWADTPRVVNFIMLNPSRADEFRNDPTVERCERRARAMGFSGFSVTNIFAWRDTDPHAMRRASEPTGPLNDAIITTAAQEADLVIAAWGSHASHRGRGPQVAQMLTQAGVPLHHLGLTKHGHPRHPLYVAYARSPILWTPQTQS